MYIVRKGFLSVLRDKFSLGVLIFYLFLAFTSFITGFKWLISVATILSILALLIYACEKNDEFSFYFDNPCILYFVFIVIVSYFFVCRRIYAEKIY
jgi:hypothetical protein